MDIGTKVRVSKSLMMYHYPGHKGEPYDVKGLEGEVKAIIESWKDRPVSANYKVLVQFPNKFKAHFSEAELEIAE